MNNLALSLAIMFILLGCASPPPLPTKSAELGPVSVKSNKIIASGKSNPLIADDEIVAQIKPGITTKAQVVSLLGESDQITVNKARGGTQWPYLYYEIYSYSPHNMKQVVLFLWFDDNGVLKPKPDGMVRHKTIVTDGKSMTTTD